MARLDEVFTHFGLSRVTAQLETTAKNSLRIAASEPNEEPVSRLGGRPNLPAGVDWPASTDGPLAFIAQLDLQRIPALPDLSLPATGSMFFFYDGNGNPKRPGDRERFRVVYSDHPLTDFPLRKFPDRLPDLHRWQGVQYGVARTEMTFPGIEDPAATALGLSREEEDGYWAFEDYWLQSQEEPRGLHRIGGYPNYIQHDPKFEAHIKSLDLWEGLWAKNGSNGDCSAETNRRFNELKTRLGTEAARWELLLQVDSEEANGMMWGDVGRLYFLIQKDHLRARRFEDAWLVWDCN